MEASLQNKTFDCSKKKIMVYLLEQGSWLHWSKFTKTFFRVFESRIFDVNALKVVSTAFLSVCFVCFKETSFKLKDVSYFTSNAFFVFEESAKLRSLRAKNMLTCSNACVQVGTGWCSLMTENALRSTIYLLNQHVWILLKVNANAIDVVLVFWTLPSNIFYLLL